MPNAQLAKTVYPYAMVSFWLWNAINLILLIASYKYIKVTKLYFLQMILYQIIATFFPLKVTAEVSLQLKMSGILTMYIMTYFNFVPDLLLTMVVPVLDRISRCLFHEEALDRGAVESTVLSMLLLGLMCWFIHICVVQIGMFYVKAEILRIGNEQLLDNLEEGVVIRDEETQEIIFIN